MTKWNSNVIINISNEREVRKMSKIRITMGATYVGCPSEEIEFEYDGTERDFNADHQISTEILNMILNYEFPHYFMNIDFEESEEEEDD